MSRAHVPESVQTQVLATSRRRCAICYGLERDTGVKKGQMAHIDGDSSNSAIDNLVFLCLEHHDEFDSRTSQSKGLTPGEVARYRSELYEHFSGWAQLATRGHLLNFLASQIGTSELAVAVVRDASGMYFYGPRHAV